MGLISLSYLNKIQNSNYWNNVWDSKLLYKKYLYLSFFINKYINNIFNDYSIDILINYIINLNLKKGYILNSFLRKKINKNFILGKIWILKYQNWYIIIIKMFTFNFKNLNLKINRNKIWLNYRNDLKFSTKFMNYKNKF